MKPNIKGFKKAVQDCNGNLTKVADFFKVDRLTIHRWINANPKFKEVVDNSRSRLFDRCLSTSEIVANGIPDYVEEINEHGEKVRRFAGWIERPDGNMLRYLMGTLGKKEGFGESVEVTLNTNINVPIHKWIEENSEKEEQETTE